MARFELTTPCAQGRCATRLRYTPFSATQGLAKSPSRSKGSSAGTENRGNQAVAGLDIQPVGGPGLHLEYGIDGYPRRNDIF